MGLGLDSAVRLLQSMIHDPTDFFHSVDLFCELQPVFDEV